MSKETFERGLEIRKAVLGAEYVEKSLDAADDFNRDFQNLVTEYCWGAGWGRTALSRRDTSLLNLVMLGALNRGQEFKLHLKGALTNGCTRDEITDTLIQLAIYAGIPAGGTFTGAEGIKTAAQAAKFGGQAGVAYDVNYHGKGDDITNINITAFDINIDVIADAVGHYAFDLAPLSKPVVSQPTGGDAGSGGGLHEGHGHEVTE